MDSAAKQFSEYRPLLASPKESLSDYVRQHCRRHHISLEQLAQKANIARGTLYAILEDKSVPKIPHLLALAQAMEVHHYFLFRLKWKDYDYLQPIMPARQESKESFHLDASGFIDETIADGTLIVAGTEFVKTWTIQNIGDLVWENRYFMHLDAPYHAINYPSDQNLADYQLLPSQTMIAMPTIYPTQTYTLSVRYTAPNISGRYISYWRMIDEDGALCFPDGIGLSVSVLVKSFGVNQRAILENEKK